MLYKKKILQKNIFYKKKVNFLQNIGIQISSVLKKKMSLNLFISKKKKKKKPL